MGAGLGEFGGVGVGGDEGAVRKALRGKGLGGGGKIMKKSLAMGTGLCDYTSRFRASAERHAQRSLKTEFAQMRPGRVLTRKGCDSKESLVPGDHQSSAASPGVAEGQGLNAFALSESLILAQNERWQRGLGMQVERDPCHE